MTVTPSWTLPSGVTAGDTLYVAGGAGTPEVVTLTGVGAACAGGSALSVCFTPQFDHSSNWSLASATSGLQEAVNSAGPGGWVMDDESLAKLQAPLVLESTVRLTGFSADSTSVGTRIEQQTPNTDTIQVGTPSTTASDVVLEQLVAIGVRGDGSDSGVAIH
ncbi:MAG: hypothetical protein ACRD1Y_11190, partial [Terriglobales bacterium]